jgi:alanyl-tRNA synthetase
MSEEEIFFAETGNRLDEEDKSLIRDQHEKHNEVLPDLQQYDGDIIPVTAAEEGRFSKSPEKSKQELKKLLENHRESSNGFWKEYAALVDLIARIGVSSGFIALMCDKCMKISTK